MAVYQPGIPTGTVDLDIDYLNLQGNFTQANIVYGTDHYPFDNATPNQGFHNVVTTPPVVNSPPDGLPPVTTTNPKMYGYEQYGALGVLQYSRGPNNAVPTPITKLNSPSTPLVIGPGSPTNVLDFAGVNLALCNLYACDFTGPFTRRTEAFVVWNGSALTIDTITATGMSANSSGSILRLGTSGGVVLTNVYWTLDLVRVQ